MNIYLIITEEKYSVIYTDDSSYHDYHITKFYSSPYTLQSDLSMDGQVITSGEILCEGTYIFPININSHYYVLQRTKYMNTIVSLSTTINGNFNVICYDYKDVVPPHIMYISHNGYNTSSLLHILMK